MAKTYIFIDKDALKIGRPICITNRLEVVLANQVLINGPARVVYDVNGVVWPGKHPIVAIETDAEVTVVD